MRISFVLPCSGRYPIGGFRIIYEYANRLAERGHAVTLVHLIAPQPEQLSRERYWKSMLQYWRDRSTGRYLPSDWFRLDPRVTTTCHFSLDARAIPDGDVIIASAWQTADGVVQAGSQAGRKFYFIQHYETWNSDHAALTATWRLPLKKIVIAAWLKEIAVGLDETADIVPNAIDHDFFHTVIPPEQRADGSILLQSHRLDWKGTKDAIKALRILRDRGLSFDLTLFGLTRPEASDIDFPYQFVLNPPQSELKRLYSQTSIFIAPSWSEGWGLTPHEAGACGAALAVTDIGGHKEFLVQGRTALMSPPCDVVALADNVEHLLQDSPFRIQLAYRAAQELRRFDWKRSVSDFEKILSDTSSGERDS
ncbi:glycosyltransferase family 4 protein [Lichenihabitans sp. Uapishka_5]|uniref:glycosyltransferase family 4 protein n=1 Tax=Lichenihabitans sp. Uapishka_5 TaxID=3037302 RepID=UPI0029E7EEA2|nr:glycosyltransferase family 4 protein [Lichenihabitans sp. Uapishka_5]MDX7952329.1 glycosyltransferase family 4 protein [Lichenihabitans sp. Uapishka_5]